MHKKTKTKHTDEASESLSQFKVKHHIYSDQEVQSGEGKNSLRGG